MKLAPLVVVVGAGGVGKTTLAAALAVSSAEAGARTLAVTFDPSHRLRQALGIHGAAAGAEVEVPLAGAAAGLWASLLDARDTFDRLVERYAPDAEVRERILRNGFYRHLAGSLSGVLEYMAVERLFEIRATGGYERVILDTPPTRAALDFLAAPERIVGFLDSGALRVGLRPWFDARGRFRPTLHLGPLGPLLDRQLDRMIGLDFLRDMVEFFRAFGPLYEGFRERALAVQAMLRERSTEFWLISGPGADRVPETAFFARELRARGHRLATVVVNRVFPRLGRSPRHVGEELPAWLGEHDHRGLVDLASRLAGSVPLLSLPLLGEEPLDLARLSEVARRLQALAPLEIAALAGT